MIEVPINFVEEDMNFISQKSGTPFSTRLFFLVFAFRLFGGIWRRLDGEEGIELSIIECVRDRNRMKEIERAGGRQRQQREGGHSLSAQMVA